MDIGEAASALRAWAKMIRHYGELATMSKAMQIDFPGKVLHCWGARTTSNRASFGVTARFGPLRFEAGLYRSRRPLACATGCFREVSSRPRMSLMGRVRPTNPLNSLPETCRSRWAAIQLTFV